MDRDDSATMLEVFLMLSGCLHVSIFSALNLCHAECESCDDAMTKCHTWSRVKRVTMEARLQQF